MAIKINRYKSYLSMVQNAVGTKMFRNLFVEQDGEEKDVFKNGKLSCAAFVSSVLKWNDLIDGTHATVGRTVQELEKFGWERVADPSPGAIILWKEKEYKDGEKHPHIGFFIGDGYAVSTSYKEKEVVKHPIDSLDGSREVEAYFWHPNLDL